MKLKQLLSLGVTKNLVRFSKANKKATLEITSKGLVTLIMESLPQSHRHEKIGLSVRYSRKIVHFKEYFINGAPLGSVGSANKSGWICQTKISICSSSRPTTPANITSGCRVAGLVPFNRFIFDGDVDFAPSFVTDRPFNSSPVPSS
ncbi:hypothetical protein DAPPUDRAFT_115408 [Daphnia pulex]|uniref:Uncharacterized protein n=1 Tax=Daphnia pulex TaxID=6669 RepID=E9HL87_DAPPU|nr:hypothetical protein DAPPUDRAFT_115408 [Daphnia pulex]|eukprot:EFX67458.1 hypothetical protein DAPPUDRAFT_115408 [Daphnia pulex]